MNNATFNADTMAPKEYRMILRGVVFLYLPITFSEEVSLTCEKMVMGN